MRQKFVNKAMDENGEGRLIGTDTNVVILDAENQLCLKHLNLTHNNADSSARCEAV